MENKINLYKKLNKNSNSLFNNIEVKMQKRKVWKALKAYLKNKNNFHKQRLQKERWELKTLKEGLDRNNKLNKVEKVENRKNMNEFWDALNKFRPKKKFHCSNITEKEWIEHFSKLLGGEVLNNSDTLINNNEPNNQDEIENDFNREITLEEIKIALSSIKNNKAAGEDEVTVEFLKELPIEWLMESTKAINGIWVEGDGKRQEFTLFSNPAMKKTLKIIEVFHS